MKHVIKFKINEWKVQHGSKDHFFEDLAEKSFKTYNLNFNLKNNIDSVFWGQDGGNLVKIIFSVVVFVFWNSYDRSSEFLTWHLKK